MINSSIDQLWIIYQLLTIVTSKRECFKLFQVHLTCRNEGMRKGMSYQDQDMYGYMATLVLTGHTAFISSHVILDNCEERTWLLQLS